MKLGMGPKFLDLEFEYEINFWKNLVKTFKTQLKPLKPK